MPRYYVEIRPQISGEKFQIAAKNEQEAFEMAKDLFMSDLRHQDLLDLSQSVVERLPEDKEQGS